MSKTGKVIAVVFIVAVGLICGAAFLFMVTLPWPDF
jgi:hypothetical protein